MGDESVQSHEGTKRRRRAERAAGAPRPGDAAAAPHVPGRVHDAVSLDLDAAVCHLRGQGLRLTKLKRAVLEEFTGGSCGFSAEELAERIGQSGDLSPLYRCLASLESAGVLTHFYLDDGSRRYDPADGFGTHHHHLVCVECAGIERMDGCGLTNDLARQAAASGFVLQDHSVTLRGLCPACRRDRAAAQPPAAGAGVDGQDLQT